MLKKIIAGAVLAMSAVAAFATNGAFVVVNESVEPIKHIFVSPPSRSQYGRTDLLGDRMIPPGSHAVVDPGEVLDSEGQCLLDVIAVGDNGSKWRRQINVCTTTRWTLSGGKYAL